MSGKMSWRVLLDAAEAVRAGAVVYDSALGALPLAGIGWATVEADRAQRELDTLLGPEDGGQPASWHLGERDPALGARVWLRSAGQSTPGVSALVLLEPDTEGRIAASLARFGEGVAVIYLGDGPAGAGRLVQGGGIWGPHVVRVDRGARQGTA